jgi:putative FmdB family regulatory protein
MPTYAYKCNDQGHQFELRQRMTDAPVGECPVCGGAARRVVGSVGVVFKGSGFYINDNRNGSNGNGAKKNGASANGSSGHEAGASGGDAPDTGATGKESKPSSTPKEKGTAVASE